MVNPHYGESDFIITPRDLLWLMIERDKRVREKVHGEVVTEDAAQGESNTEKKLPTVCRGVDRSLQGMGCKNERPIPHKD